MPEGLPRIVLSSQEILHCGLELLGFDDKRQSKVNKKKNMARFRAHYASHPRVYAVLIQLLQTTENPDANINCYIDQVGTEQFKNYYFMAIHLMACYPTEEEAEAVWSKLVAPYSKTWSNWSWRIVGCISELISDVVNWPESWSNPDNPDSTETIFILTVDGVHCPIEEPPHDNFSENKKFFSHKFHGAGLDYEIGMSIFTQRCVWVAGPYPAGKNDISIFRHKLKGQMLAARESSKDNVQFRGLADKGYMGERDLLSVPSSQVSACM
ncbi:hypothetical protein SEMRO_1085_G239520.1 [Seminavis robusta]|uniref:DDE Tnp4 domain-containing protein n=1 Tax=Seminavis robusta TaxID=568900 RepID=A0A9N8EJ67_9STRA|nr:hypothetical protein SEMRO_1085_G239520.1 [Seminavis robusta]|eukprot:Sro1085_g239520.1 n/a (268) ;mRNA; f:954-1757